MAEWEAPEAYEQRIAEAAAKTAKNAADPKTADLPAVEPDHKFTLPKQGKAKGALWETLTDEEKKVRFHFPPRRRRDRPCSATVLCAHRWTVGDAQRRSMCARVRVHVCAYARSRSWSSTQQTSCATKTSFKWRMTWQCLRLTTRF
jgi:hypothetical protein